METSTGFFFTTNNEEMEKEATDVYSTESSSDPATNNPEPATSDAIKNLIFAGQVLLCFTIISGNSMVIHISRVWSSITAANRILIANLAGADLILGTLPLVMTTLGRLNKIGAKVMIGVQFINNVALQTAFMTAIVMTALWLRVISKLQVVSQDDYKMASVLAPIVWFIGILLSLPTIIYSDPNTDNLSPSGDLIHPIVVQYNAICLLLMVLTVVGLLFATALRIWLISKKVQPISADIRMEDTVTDHEQQTQNQRSSTAVEEQESRANLKKKKKLRKAYIMIAMVCACMVICYLPGLIAMLVALHLPKSSKLKHKAQVASDVLLLPAVLHSLINVIIYMFRDKTFRKKICCRIGKK